MQDKLDLEAVRRRYLPASGIRILLLGESPPPIRGFFYTGDSTLFEETVTVFAEECGFPSEASDFLDRFCDAGFFVEDFSQIRGDKPANRADAPDVQAAVRRLAGLIDDQGPVAVVGLLKRIRGLVGRTVAASAHPATPWRCLTFPYWKSENKRARYRDELRQVLRDYGC
jgi:hypothetical protein